MAAPHTYTGFDRDLSELHDTILQMGEHVLQAVGNAVDALLANDHELAVAVEHGDDTINKLRDDVAHLVLRALTRQQPVAQDLRRIMAAQHIAIDLERTGDHAKAIARVTGALQRPLSARATAQLRWLRSRTIANLQSVLHAYREWQLERTADLLLNDRVIDKLYRRLFASLLAAMKDGSVSIEDGSQLLFVAKSLERIGDHARNIGADLQFVATGVIAGHQRS